MEDTLVAFEIALLAYRKGFNILNLDTNTYPIDEAEQKVYNLDVKEIPCPTQSLLQRWLRERHQIHIIISQEMKEYWKYHIPNIGGKDGFVTYEVALEMGLKEALKLI